MELNLEDVGKTYLEGHFLLDSSKKRDLVEVVDKISGLNAQTARAPYISLYSRIDNFERGMLARALYKNRFLVKTWLMRGTVHIIPACDFAIYQKALRGTLLESWEQHTRR